MTNRETARKLVEETIGVPPFSTSFINEMLEDAITAALDEAEARGIARQCIREMNEDVTADSMLDRYTEHGTDDDHL